MKNNKLLILVLGLALVGLFTAQTYNARANTTTLKDKLKFDNSVPLTVGTSASDNSNSVPVSTSNKKSTDDILKNAEKLIRKSESVYLVEGWLHISSTTQSFAPESAVLPDGSPTPTQWADDLWVLLDKNGNAIQAVTLQNTGAPSTSQVSIFDRGIWTNKTLDIVSQELEVYKPTLDSGLRGSVIPYKNSVMLEQYNEVINGQEVVVFVSTEKYKDPIKLLKDTKDKKAKEINGVAYKYYFSLDTGLPVQVDDYSINADGTMEILQSISNILVEKINNPPDSILSYFSK
jgi:hypothetical protein